MHIKQFHSVWREKDFPGCSQRLITGELTNLNNGRVFDASILVKICARTVLGKGYPGICAVMSSWCLNFSTCRSPVSKKGIKVDSKLHNLTAFSLICGICAESASEYSRQGCNLHRMVEIKFHPYFYCLQPQRVMESRKTVIEIVGILQYRFCRVSAQSALYTYRIQTTFSYRYSCCPASNTLSFLCTKVATADNSNKPRVPSIEQSSVSKSDLMGKVKEFSFLKSLTPSTRYSYQTVLTSARIKQSLFTQCMRSHHLTALPDESEQLFLPHGVHVV